MRLPFNYLYHGCIYTEQEETIIHFLCKCPSLVRCTYRLFGSPTLVSLTELSSIDVRYIALFKKLSGWFSRRSCFRCAALALINFSLLVSEELGQHRDCVQLWHHKGLLCKKVML